MVGSDAGQRGAGDPAAPSTAARAELALDGALLRLALDEAPVSVAIVDDTLRVVSANRHFELLFGAVVGGPCFQIFKGRSAPCEPCVVRTARESQLPAESEEHGRDLAGNEAVFKVRAVPLPRAGAIPPGVLHICLDVTRRCAAEARLGQAERLAGVGLTVAGLAHTIKNILAGLEGGVYVVDSGLTKQNPARVQGGWELVKRYLEQVGQLVQRLLSYARPEARERTEFDPAELVHAAVALYESKAELVGIQVRGTVSGNPPRLCADREALEACLANLLSNAMDACLYDPRDDKVHAITVEAAPAPGGGVTFVVADNGKGIAVEDQPKLLKEIHTTKGLRGTGLGLLLTQQAVEQHGGRIRFDSIPEQGTRFIIDLPGAHPR